MYIDEKWKEKKIERGMIGFFVVVQAGIGSHGIVCLAKPPPI